MRAQGISQQDQSRSQRRQRCRTTTKTDARVLRLLRLAFLSAWALAAGAVVAHFPGRIVRQRRTRCLENKPQLRKSEAGSGISAGRRPGEFRTSIRIGVAVATLRRVARMGRSAGARNVTEFETAGGRRGRAVKNLAAETFTSGAHRRARSNSFRSWTDSR